MLVKYQQAYMFKDEKKQSLKQNLNSPDINYANLQ